MEITFHSWKAEEALKNVPSAPVKELFKGRIHLEAAPFHYLLHLPLLPSFHFKSNIAKPASVGPEHHVYLPESYNRLPLSY